MKLKKIALISLAAFIGFTLFYIGLNQWQKEKESTGKINIISSYTPTTQPQQAQPPPAVSQPSPQSTQSQITAQTQNNKPIQNTQQVNIPSPTPTIPTQTKPTPTTPKNTENKTSKTVNSSPIVFQIGAFKSSASAQNAINKAKSLGFSPIVKQEKGFYIIRVELQGSKDGIKLLTAFPGAFRVH